MESPRKFNDCYFYYYSTCTKGDNCVFRHEPSALGCETMCTAWQQGKCLDKRCKLRHMELRKNRKQIPCYWENQPGGCRKIHCPFMHKNPDARTDGIAPSQPAPPTQAQSASGNETGSGEQPTLGGGVGGVSGAAGVGGVVGAGPVPAPAAAPAPVPLLWQQQRQVVLDSAILGVLPASTELLGTRRVVPHPHEPAPNPYAPLPVDPLVVNFEEESDNESAPPSTPIKPISPEEALQLTSPQHKEQELLLLEKIQAAAAAYYGYDPLSTAETTKNERKVRTNLSTKYDRLSLDEIAGRKRTNVERRGTLDFKVLSLDEIRARKNNSDSVVHKGSVKVNFSRKRKLSTQETITSGGNKIIKVVRSNSVVYKKVKQNASVATSQSKVENKHNEDVNRKRTHSDQSDILYDMQDDELVDNCYEFKKIKLTEQTTKPRLIRNRQVNTNKNVSESSDSVNSNDKTEDSDSEVQIVSVEISDNRTKLSDTSDSEVIDVDSTKMGEPLDIVDLSDDADDCEVTEWSDVDLDLIHNVPDVVSSCSRFTNKMEGPSTTDVVNDIDALLDEEL